MSSTSTPKSMRHVCSRLCTTSWMDHCTGSRHQPRQQQLSIHPKVQSQPVRRALPPFCLALSSNVGQRRFCGPSYPLKYPQPTSESSISCICCKLNATRLLFRLGPNKIEDVNKWTPNNCRLLEHPQLDLVQGACCPHLWGHLPFFFFTLMDTGVGIGGIAKDWRRRWRWGWGWGLQRNEGRTGMMVVVSQQMQVILGQSRQSSTICEIWMCVIGSSGRPVAAWESGSRQRSSGEIGTQFQIFSRAWTPFVTIEDPLFPSWNIPRLARNRFLGSNLI